MTLFFTNRTFSIIRSVGIVQKVVANWNILISKQMSVINLYYQRNQPVQAQFSRQWASMPLKSLYTVRDNEDSTDELGAPLKL